MLGSLRAISQSLLHSYKGCGWPKIGSPSPPLFVEESNSMCHSCHNQDTKEPMEQGTVCHSIGDTELSRREVDQLGIQSFRETLPQKADSLANEFTRGR